jgi:hypothetical protein
MHSIAESKPSSKQGRRYIKKNGTAVGTTGAAQTKQAAADHRPHAHCLSVLDFKKRSCSLSGTHVFPFPYSPPLSLVLFPDTHPLGQTTAVSMDPAKLAVTPALAPPPGVISNFVNSYSLLPWIVATATVCVVLTALVLALRMFTRAVVIKSLDWTDCMFNMASPL